MTDGAGRHQRLRPHRPHRLPHPRRPRRHRGGAINDLFDNDQLAYLLKYDTVMRVFPKRGRPPTPTTMYVDGKAIAMTAEQDPARIPWGEHGVDVVVESTGVFTDARRAREAPRRPARGRSSSPCPPRTRSTP